MAQQVSTLEQRAITQKPLINSVGMSSSPAPAGLLSGRKREGMQRPGKGRGFPPGPHGCSRNGSWSHLNVPP